MLLDSTVCDFGWSAPDFTLKDPIGRAYTVKQQLGDKGLLVAFICNHCAYVKAIAGRHTGDTKHLMSEGINVIAVISNYYRSVPADSPENMAKFSAHHDFPAPYQIDEDQSVRKAYGAVCAPGFFGCSAKGELQYLGRLWHKKSCCQISDGSLRESVLQPA